MNERKSLKRGIAVIFGANLLNLIFNLLTNFLLPKYLSVDCYAEIKTFQLYVSYAGVLHFGYEDGMYIKYGGCQIGRIDKKELKADLNTLLCFQLVLSCLLFISSIIMDSVILSACSLAIFPLNVACYYKLLFQAIGEFEAYAKISNATTVITFATNIVLLLLNCFSEYQIYLIAYVAVDFLIMMFCVKLFNRKNQWHGGERIPFFSWEILVNNIKNGMFLMLGNFSSMILTGMDRWFIKALMDNVAFAMYSFAVSMEGLMSVAITPISTTLYNYFCTHTDELELKKVKSKIILFATGIVSCAFPAKFILETYLTLYLDSSSVIFYLFAAQMFYIVVKCFYVNLYKAQKKQKVYFIKLVAVILFGFIINAVCYALMHTKEAFAIGTLICGIIWLVMSETDFKQVRSGINEVFYFTIAVVGYILIGTTSESIIGFLMYISLLLVLAAIFMRESFLECVQIAKSIFEKLSERV